MAKKQFYLTLKKIDQSKYMFLAMIIIGFLLIVITMLSLTEIEIEIIQKIMLLFLGLFLIIKGAISYE